MKTYIYILAITILTITSCDSIHEFPNENAVDHAAVNLNVKVAFNISDIQNTVLNTESRSVSTDQCLRFIIEIYKYDNTGQAAVRREVIVPQINPHEVTINETFMLNATKYFILVWADYLNKDKPSDQFYGTQSLYSISFIEPFISDTDNRDCFVGIADADLLPYQGQWNVHTEVTVPLYRPVAKYALIANDIDKYKMQLANKGNGGEYSINDYTAVVYYPGYMPNSFNARTSQPNDSRTGLSFISKCHLINDKEALICFDYPLVNGEKSQAKLKLQLYDDQGKLINEIEDITFPIKRDSLTIIRSDYFTRNYSPGITINPGYEGSIDIELPD